MKSNHFSSAALQVVWSRTLPTSPPSGRPNVSNASSKIAS